MHPLQLAAQFCAYVWFSRHQPHDAVARQQAKDLARQHWVRFLPLAPEGVGRLLLQIASPATGIVVAPQADQLAIGDRSVSGYPEMAGR
jgi:hypothetical protein